MRNNGQSDTYSRENSLAAHSTLWAGAIDDDKLPVPEVALRKEKSPQKLK